MIGFDSPDPRDKIYAVPGLARESDRDAIPIDYGSGIEQLYIDVIWHIISTERNLEIIGSLTTSAGPYRLGSPNFSPDGYDARIIISNPLSRGHHASGDVPLNVQFTHMHEGDTNILDAEGIMFNTISTIEQKVDSKTAGSLALECLKKKIPPTDPRHHLGRRGSIWRTCIADRGERGEAPASTDFLTMHEVLTGLHTEIPSDFEASVPSHLTLPNSRVERFVKPFKENMKHATSDRKLFATDTGFIGLYPNNAEVGDLVVVLFGGHVPYVLREKGKDYKLCVLIREAFVHSIMCGELVKLCLQKPGSETLPSQMFPIV
jgi:hypothetical protein